MQNHLTGVQYIQISRVQADSLFKESDQQVIHCVQEAIEQGMTIIVPVGESLEERQADKTEEVITNQLITIDRHLKCWSQIVVVYEPSWHTNMGTIATPEMVQEVHTIIRSWVSKNISKEEAKQLKVIYGQNVNQKDAKFFIEMPDIDGFFLKDVSTRSDFGSIVDICQAYQDKKYID